MGENEEKLHLVELDRYLKTGSHIGTKFKTGDMQRYIFKQRKDGLRVLDVSTIDERIRIAGKFLAKFEPAKIAAVSRKAYGQEPARQFAAILGAKALLGRFIPGTFTNPLAKKFFEPGVIIITDPESDRQAIAESVKLKAPIVALCSTNNYLRNIDLVIPINNKGRKSIALVYFLLTREILKERGLIKKDSDFDKKEEDFEYKLKEGAEEEADAFAEEKKMKRQMKGGRREGRKFEERRFEPRRGGRRFER